MNKQEINKYEIQENIKQKLLKPIYNGCNDSFYLIWKNKHDEYVNKCFNEKYIKQQNRKG